MNDDDQTNENIIDFGLTTGSTMITNTGSPYVSTISIGGGAGGGSSYYSGYAPGYGATPSTVTISAPGTSYAPSNMTVGGGGTGATATTTGTETGTTTSGGGTGTGIQPDAGRFSRQQRST